MAIPSWASQTITRIRPGTKESRGSVIPDWNNTDRLDIGGCSVQPASTGVVLEGRVLGIEEGLSVLMPEGSDVIAGDRIEYDGNIYTINGEPKKWTSPTGRVSHIALSLERWYG